MSDALQMDGMPFDIPGGWMRRTVSIVDGSFDLVLPADPDCVLETLLDAAESQGDDGAGVEPDPYWATLWSSATPTAEAVLLEDWRGDESVLEIGCGMGLVGLAALARGLQVTFSDYVPHAVQMALQNACRNGYPAARGLLLDWNRPSDALANRRYSVILASDILYNCENHLAILNTIEQALAPDGVCWIGDPGRYHSRVFLQAASDRFRVRLCDREGDTFSVPLAGQYQMFVLRRGHEVTNGRM